MVAEDTAAARYCPLKHRTNGDCMIPCIRSLQLTRAAAQVSHIAYWEAFVHLIRGYSRKLKVRAVALLAFRMLLIFLHRRETPIVAISND